MVEQPALMTPRQAAEVLGRNVRTVTRWPRNGTIPGLGVQIGQRLFIRHSVLQRLIGDQTSAQGRDTRRVLQ